MGRYGRITGEIKESMTSFLKIDFVHKWREFNQEAHKLARSAIYPSKKKPVVTKHNYCIIIHPAINCQT